MIAKQLRIEALVTRPPPKQDIMSLFNTSTDDCNDCELEPVLIEHHEDGPSVSAAADDDDGGGLIKPADDTEDTPNC